MLSEAKYLVVQVSAPNEAEARMIARSVVERKLAASAQIFPVYSVYEWRNEIKEHAEYLILLKSKRNLYPALEALLTEIHSYEVPEIFAIPFVAGATSYLQWIDAVTNDA